ncbi:MAG: polyprenyl synthetase family protein [Thermodesulfobacteriota bacterium]
MDLAAYLADRRALVEKALAASLPEPNGYLADHLKAMGYSLLAGGKRVRPILCLAAAEALGCPAERALPAACALEYVHTYSLIHDDLPAMDDDDLRRGRPTSHKVFGEAAAILAGDSLLTMAFEILSRPATPLPADQCLTQVRILARAAGPLGMVGGQAVDIASEGQPVDADTLAFIHRHKTGALITAAVQLGAVAAAADEGQFAAFTAYGQHLGLTFQIVDDILNVTSTPEELGKAVGSDAARHKATYPGLFGMEASWRKAEAAAQAAASALAGLGENAWHLRALARYVLTRKR